MVHETKNVDNAEVLKSLRESLAVISDNDPEAVRELADQALKFSREVGDRITEGMGLATLARLHARKGEHKPAQELALSALEIFEEEDHERGMPGVYNILGVTYEQDGKYHQAIEYYHRALAWVRSKQEWSSVGHVTNNLGLLFFYLGELETAIDYFKESIQSWNTAQEEAGKANTLLNLGLVFSQLNDFESTESYFLEAKALYEKHGDRSGLSSAYRNLGQVALKRGNYADATEKSQQAIEIAREIQDPFRLAHGYDYLGQVYLAENKDAEAELAFKEALKLYQDLEILRGEVTTGINLGALKSLSWEQRQLRLQKALVGAEKLRMKAEQVTIHQMLSELFKDQNDWKQAFHHFETAYRIEHEVLTERADQRAKSLRIVHEVERTFQELEIERLRNGELAQALHEVEAMRREAEEASRQKTEVLNIAAHDLRNMSGGILSSADYLKDYFNREGAPCEDVSDLIDAQERAARELHSTLVQLLDMNAIEKGTVELHRQRIDVGEILRYSFEFWVPKAAAKHQIFSFPTVESAVGDYDPVRLREIFDNLFSNAIKYTPEGGRVRAELKVEEDAYVIEISDSGPGFSEKDLQRIFKPFQKLSAKPTSGEGSLGLGLFIVQKLIGLHGGRLDLESLNPKGTLFRVSLPKHQ